MARYLSFLLLLVANVPSSSQTANKATVAAGPVFKLLGTSDLGTSSNYRSEKMPAYNTDVLDGDLAWRQHDGGHTDAPNFKYSIPWANRELGYVVDIK